jgi:polar amino acid transport system substrate-binding protein
MRARLVAAVATLALALTGCTAAQEATDPPDTTPVRPRPAGVQDPAPQPSGSASAATCNPLLSLRPAGLPPPGQPPANSTMARIAQRGNLIVGVSQNTYLFGHRDPVTGQLVGFEVDLAREIARALFGDPNRVIFRAMTAAERIPALQNDGVDLVVRAMTMTCDRWQQISFSTEYYTGTQRLLVPVDSPFKSIDDMGGRKVCAATGSTNITAIQAAASKPVAVAAPDALDCMVLLQQGQIDAVSSDDAILAGFAAQDPSTRVVGPGFAAAPYGIGVKKENADLVRFVNGVLDSVRANGTWTVIYNRWLTALGAAPPPPPARYQA